MKWRSSALLGAAAILLLALGLRLVGLDKSMWADEFSSLQAATSPAGLRGVLAYDHPPVYFLALHFWAQIDANVPFLRLLSVPAGVATVGVLIAWLWPYSRSAALLAGLLSACSLQLLRYSQEIRNYGFWVLLSALAFLIASRLIEKPGRRALWLILGLVLSLAVATHIAGIFLLPALAVYVAASVSPLDRIDRPGAIAAAAAPVAMLGLLMLLLPSTSTRIPATWGVPPLSPVEIARALKNALFGEYHPSWVALGVVVAVTFVCAAAGPRRNLPLLLAGGTYCAGVALYSAFGPSIFIGRVLLPALIPLIVFLSLQAATMRWRALGTAVGVLLVATAAVSAREWVHTLGPEPIQAWREVAVELRKDWGSGGSAIVIPGFNIPLLRYYAPDAPATAILSLDSISNVADIGDAIRSHIHDHPNSTVTLVIPSRWGITVPQSARRSQAILALDRYCEMRHELAIPAFEARQYRRCHE